MTEPHIPDPLDELRRANPADVDQLSSASLARVRARVQEVTMTDRTPGESRSRRRSPAGLALGGGLAALLVVAVVVLGTPGQPGTTPGPSTIPGVGLCVEAYSLETLRHRSFAFDGTVTALDGGIVTFDVHTAFRGVSPGTVELTIFGMSEVAITPVDGPSLEVGRRYLVAGEQRIVWGCGFTQAYDPATAARWADTFGD